MKKRIVAVLLLVALLMSVLSACQVTVGGNSATQAPAANNNQGNTENAGNAADPASPYNFTVPAGGYDGSEVTIKFYHTMGANLRAVLDEYIVEFNKIYPNIHIEHEQVGSYDDVRDQIKTELTAGNQPNIAYCYPDHVAVYNIASAVVQLDGLIESQESDGNGGILGLTDTQKGDFVEGYYNEGMAYGDGLMYTMPMSKSTEVLYYDKTFFEANGLTVPTTWDEMEAVCAKILEIDPNCTPLGYDSESNWFITYCEQAGTPYTSATGDHFLFNTPENRAFVERINSWFQKGYLQTETTYGTYTSGLFTSTEKNRSYMCIGSSAGASYQRPDKLSNGQYRFDVGIAPVPQVDPANPKVISQGPSLCIFQKENPQEVIASWLFVKYLTTTVEFQADFSIASGYVPVIKSVADDPFYADHLANADGGDHISALSLKVGLEQQDAYYVSPAFNGSSVARDEVGKLVGKCLMYSGDNVSALIEEAFEEAVANCKYQIGQ